MMRLPSINSADFIRILKKLGYTEKARRGSHVQFVHANHGGKVTVQHPIKDVTKKNLESMIRQAGLTKKEFRALYRELH